MSRTETRIANCRVELARYAARSVDLRAKVQTAEREGNTCAAWTAKAALVTYARKRDELTKHMAKLERLAR